LDPTYIIWGITLVVAGFLFVLWAREVSRMRKTGDRFSIRLLLIVVGIVGILFGGIVGPTEVDEAMLHRQFEPLLLKDYPGWDFSAFSY